jgi:hypothetical protein
VVPGDKPQRTSWAYAMINLFESLPSSTTFKVVTTTSNGDNQPTK